MEPMMLMQLMGMMGGSGGGGMGLNPLAMAGNAAQIGFGIYDLIQARKYGNEPKPLFEIPKTAQDALRNAQMLASQRTALGDRMRPQMEQQSAATMGNVKDIARSSGEAIGGLTNIDVNNKSVLREIEKMDYQNWASAQSQLQSQQGIMSGWQQEAWKWDKQKPYLDAMAKAAEFEKAGREEIMGGISSLTGGAAVAGQGNQGQGSQGMDFSTLLKIINQQNANAGAGAPTGASYSPQNPYSFSAPEVIV